MLLLVAEMVRPEEGASIWIPEMLLLEMLLLVRDKEGWVPFIPISLFVILFSFIVIAAMESI